MKNLITGIIFGLMAQAATFFQLQGPLKWLGWNKYYWVVVCAGIPISMLYIKSVKHLVGAFDGALWPSRLIGFGLGAIIFTWLSWLIFKEPMTIKTIISLILAGGILSIQIFWKN